MIQVEVSEGFCGRCLMPLPEGKTGYCSKACRRRAWQRRRDQRAKLVGQVPNNYCPRPDKTPFRTAEAAEKRMKYRYPTSMSELNVYLCRCNWWHIGHKA